jgi:predicted amidohydrolase YtcJ
VPRAYGTLNPGLPVLLSNRLTEYMKQLQNIDETGEGFDFLIHTIGDAAARQALNAIETTREDGFETRHRLTHVELVHQDDLHRFKELGTIADPQVSISSTIYSRLFLYENALYCTTFL